MAHIHTYGTQCSNAMPIIHLGATSCYVGDNTDIILMREALVLVRGKLVRVLDKLARFADTYKALPTLGFTHFQSAQMVTVGKRATLWMNELLMDLEEVKHRISSLKLLGSKGTTGTQASFLELFEGDHAKVKEADRRIAAKLGFEDGTLAGYLAGSDTKVTLDQLLMTVSVSGGGYTVSNGGQYLRMDTGLMAGTDPVALTIASAGEQTNAYQVRGQRFPVTLCRGYELRQHHLAHQLLGPQQRAPVFRVPTAPAIFTSSTPMRTTALKYGPLTRTARSSRPRTAPLPFPPAATSPWTASGPLPSLTLCSPSNC